MIDRLILGVVKVFDAIVKIVIVLCLVFVGEIIVAWDAQLISHGFNSDGI